MANEREISPRNKKRLTYFTIGAFFMLTGIEYAVILPSVYIYVQDRYHGEDIMLGLTIGAFSFSGLLSSPIMGRWADKTRRTKCLILFCNMWEIAGSFMYFMGISKWFIIGSRLVSGVGTGAAPCVFADLCRGSSVEDRTGILTYVLACRQIGLLIGPAFNLFFSKLNFYLGPFLVDSYSMPGLFMSILWLLHQFVVLFLYFDLSALYEQEKRLKDSMYYGYLNSTASQVSNTFRNYNSISNDPGSYRSIDYVREPAGKVEEINTDLNNKAQSIKIFSQPQSPTIPIRYDEPFVVEGLSNNVGLSGRTLSRSVAQSNQIIEIAENFITSTSSVSNVQQQTSSCVADFPYSSRTRLAIDSPLLSSRRFCCATPPLLHGEPLPQHAHIIDSSDSSSVEEAAIEPNNEVTLVAKPVNYAKEYLREEVIVLLFVTFVTFFNEMTLETILTPLTKKFYNFGTFNNSIMFSLLAGVIIVMFVAVKFFSQRFEDRVLIISALVITLAGFVWTMFSLSSANSNDWSSFPSFVIACLLIVVSLPFLVVCITSLYSKIISTENQALGHGIRRSVTNIAMIIGPLWGSSLLTRLYIMYGILISLMVIALIMFAMSYKFLAVPHQKLSSTSTPNSQYQPLLRSPVYEVT